MVWMDLLGLGLGLGCDCYSVIIEGCCHTFTWWVVLLLLFVCSGVLSVVRLSLLLLASSHYEVQGTVHVPYGNKK